MKISQRTTNDLLTLIEHARHDIHYGEGGTYNAGEDEIDYKAIKKAERAIDFIKSLILGV